MSSHTRTHYIKWTCRILAILYVSFFSLMAFDVFGQGYSLKETLFALFMHLIPVALLLIATVVAWYRPALGGVWFVFLALVSVFFFNTYTDLVTFMLVSLPAFIIGGLFLWIDLGYHETAYDEQASEKMAS